MRGDNNFEVNEAARRRALSDEDFIDGWFAQTQPRYILTGRTFKMSPQEQPRNDQPTGTAK